MTPNEELALAWLQNDCGDEKCKAHRLQAALLVLRGGKEHMDYAEMVRIIDYQEKQTDRCLLPPRGWYCSRQPGHDGPCAARLRSEQGDTP